MNKLRARTHNVAAVPLWLVALIEKSKSDYSTLLSYEQLSTILSTDDVCFYHHYLLNNKLFIGNAFDDMCNIASQPENMAWIAQNEQAAMTTKLLFNSALEKNESKLAAVSTPDLVRKCSYVPRAVNENTLLLLAVSEPTNVDARSFLKACVEQLHLQKCYDEIKQFKVFQKYCNS